MTRDKSRYALKPEVAAVLFTLILFPTQLTWAGARLECKEARVFRDAAVNALVLPYRYEKPIRFDPNSTNARLSALIQQETLFSMLKYGSVGATELVSEDGRVCDVREVLTRIMRDSKHSPRPGHGVVLIWRRIYEEKSQVYVQSYIRFLRHAEEETIRVGLSAAGNRKLELSASLPAQAVAMVPRRFTQEDLAEIQRRAADILIVRTNPTNTAPRVPLGPIPTGPLAYGVVDVKGDWMKILSHITGETGWVRARMDSDAWALRRFLPEIAYLEGVIAYLRMRSEPRVQLTNDPTRIYGWMQQGFADYERAVGMDGAPEAAGLASAMKGIALWTQPKLADRRQEAVRLFQETLEQMPGSSAARELATVTSPFAKPSSVVGRETLGEVHRGLLGAIALDPGNRSALRNIERLYEFAISGGGLDPYRPEELKARLALVKAASTQKSGAR